MLRLTRFKKTKDGTRFSFPRSRCFSLATRGLLELLALGLLFGCASGREFWTRVVEEPVSKPQFRERGTVLTPGVATGQTVRVAFNDGATSTEVDIPVLSSGQI